MTECMPPSPFRRLVQAWRKSPISDAETQADRGVKRGPADRIGATMGRTTPPRAKPAGLSSLVPAIIGLVIAVGAGLGACAQSSAPDSVRGIYFVANMGRGDSLTATGTRRDFTAALANRYINGAYLKDYWNSVEPADGVYDWAAFDKQIRVAEAAGKKIALAIQAGTKTPSWVYAEGARPFQTITTETAEGNFCQSQNVPIPWDPVFLRKWTALVAAFGAHYANDPHVVQVKITGIDITTDETVMPHSRGETRSKKKGSRAGVPCTFPNDNANWISEGYSQAKVFGAWKQMAHAFAAAFPKQALTVMTSTHAMPSIGPDGQVDPTGAAENFASDTFLSYGAATFGRRFVAAQNGWRPNHLDEGVLRFASRTGNPFGWQPSWPIKCKDGGGRQRIGSEGCTERRAVEQLFQNGLKDHPAYLELLLPLFSTNAYDDLIKDAYTNVVGDRGY